MPNAVQNDQAAQLAKLADEIQNLTESPLYAYRVQQGYRPVSGEGSPTARIMLIGEAPGEAEAKSGRPFVGASGRVLSELLAQIGLTRAEVYITNVVKDRPPDNRDPTAAEIALYRPFLARQVAIIQPRIIATLGRFAMDFIFGFFAMQERGAKISRVHGQQFRAQASYGPVVVVPLYHPAVALYAAGQRQTLREDFQVLQKLVEQE